MDKKLSFLQEYFYIGDDMQVHSELWTDFEIDKQRINANNLFLDEEKANIKAEEMRNILKDNKL